LIGGSSSEHRWNPTAPGTIRNALSPAVLKIRTRAKGKERIDDLALRIDRRWRAGSASSGILHGQVKRGGPGFVLDRRVASGSEKKVDGGGAPCSDGAVERSRAIHVLQMDVRSLVKEATDRLYLSFRIPCGTRDEPVCGVMQRSAFAAIRRRVRIGA